MTKMKEYFVVFKNLIYGCYYFDTHEAWKQHYKEFCEFIALVDSAQEAQEICTNLEKQQAHE